jgi:hypothetical protein
MQPRCGTERSKSGPLSARNLAMIRSIYLLFQRETVGRSRSAPASWLIGVFHPSCRCPDCTSRWYLLGSELLSVNVQIFNNLIVKDISTFRLLCLLLTDLRCRFSYPVKNKSKCQRKQKKPGSTPCAAGLNKDLQPS